MNISRLAVLFCIVLSGCGGGGGGGDDVESFVGRWTGRMEALDDFCVALGFGDFNFAMTVNQDGTDVVVDSDSGDTFVGTVTGPKLDVFKTQPSSCTSGSGQLTTQIVLTKLDGSETRGIGVLQIKSSCGNAELSCEFVADMTRTS